MLDSDSDHIYSVTSLDQILFTYLPIQTKKRSKMQQCFIYGHYSLDYIALWLLVYLTFSPQTVVLKYSWPFLIVRGAAAIFYIFMQHPSLLCLNKLSLVLELTFSTDRLLYGECLIAVLQIVMSAVWALTREQRMIHFDSRLGLTSAFGKQTTIYISMALTAVMLNRVNGNQNQFSLFGLLLLLAAVDFSDLIYLPKTKQMFVRMDLILLLLLLISIFHETLGINYVQFLFASVLLFLAAFLHLFFSPTFSYKILTVSSLDVQKLKEIQLIEYLIELKRSLYEQNLQKIETYLFKLREESQDQQLLDRIKLCQQKDIAIKKELISNYLFDILRKTTRYAPRLRDLALFLHAPSPRAYPFIDFTYWNHRREYHRIITEQVTDEAMQQAESQKQLSTVRDILNNLTILSDYFYQELMRERISERKIMDLGQGMMELLDRLKVIAKVDKKRSKQIIELVNRYCEECLPARFQFLIMKNKEGDQVNKEFDNGELLLGGEEDNFLNILQVNGNFIKMTYHRKQNYRGKSITKILADPFAQLIIQYLKNRSSQDQLNRPFQRKLIYLYNTLGYLSFAQLSIEQTSHRGGRGWKMTLKEEHSNRLIIVMDGHGIFVGCTELCRFEGFTPELKGQTIRQEFAKQVLNSNYIHLDGGQNLFQSVDHSAVRRVILSIVDHIKLPTINYEFFLLQIKITQGTYLNPMSFGNPLDPPQFHFNFHWSGKISTEKEQFDLVLSQRHSSVREGINYGENITEMRYYQGKIDYKSNFEEERDCPSLQLRLEQALSSLTANQYYERWQLKKNKIPDWFKVVWILIIILALAGLIATIFIFYQFNGLANQSNVSIQTVCKLFQKKISVIRLGSLTTGYKLNLNASSLINQEIINTNQISNQIFLLSQNVFGQYGGQAILDQMNSLNLMINSFQLINSSSYSNILTVITNKFQPGIQFFINNYIGLVNTSAKGFQDQCVVILVIIFIGALACIIIFTIIEWRLHAKNSQIVEILKFIDNDHLEIYRKKLALFKEMWLENGQIRDLDQQEKDQNAEQSSPPKHLVKGCQIGWAKAWYLSWLGLMITLLLLLNRNVIDYSEMMSEYISYENSLTSHLSTLQTIWTEFNNSPANLTLIRSLMTSSYTFEYQKLIQIKTMSSLNKISPIYLEFYKHFWENSDFCQQISRSDCLTFIGGAAQEGGNMIINYLNRHYDSFLQNNFTKNALYSLNQSQSLGLINLFYLSEFATVNNKAMLQQYQFQNDKLLQRASMILVVSLVTSLLILALIIYYRGQRMRVQQMQQLLMVIPFDRLKQIASFHRFYLDHYVSY